jgi:hypothetical protein
MTVVSQLRRPDPHRDDSAVKTWRYLRLAMIAVVFGLFVAVLTEHAKAKPSCFLGSISDYYYTPVRGYFVAATLALGLCLICLRGSTEVEDGLLNLAGMLAPIVALVPTEYALRGPHCPSVPTVFDDRAANVANNVLALVVVGLIVLVVVWVKIGWKGATLPMLLSAVSASLLWGLATGLFLGARSLWLETAHFAAAVPMFVCIALAAIANAFDVDDTPKRWMYAVIAVAMVILPLCIGGALLLANSNYTLIVVETLVLGLFAVFWIVQTRDLWHDGIRPTDKGRLRRVHEKVIQGRSARLERR